MSDYWIIARESNYRWSVVGARNYEALVIFSRTRKLRRHALREILLDAREQGYDINQLVYDRY